MCAKEQGRVNAPSYRWIALFALLRAAWTVAPAVAHDDHAPTPRTTTEETRKSEAVSDKYEYVLKYHHADVGDIAHYTLYINEFLTNAPVVAGSLALTLSGNQAMAKPTGPGTYEFDAKVASATPAQLQVKLAGKGGADLVMLTGINPAEHGEEEVHEDAAIPIWLVALLAALGGAVLVFLLMYRRPRVVAALLALGLTIPARGIAPALAHDEPAPQPSHAHGLPPGMVLVAKESQFLFEMRTERLAAGGFASSIKVFGTIVPSPQGSAQVLAPQISRIVALNAAVGQKVRKGQALATIEQVLDASAQVALSTQRNDLRSELAAARADYERLQTVADIASRKEVDNAKARFDKARANFQLFQNTQSGQGGPLRTYLLSPIDGVVQNFSQAVRSVVNAGEALFTVTDLNRVFVESQVFDKDLPLFSQAARFTVHCADPARKHITAQVKLVSLGQTLNPSNQSHRVLFEVVNSDGDFKIGEFVDVRAYSKPSSTTLSIPNTAITEVDGKPAVFVKTAPELFTLSFVQLGEGGAERTPVLGGVKAGDRILATSAYQAKIIYENP